MAIFAVEVLHEWPGLAGLFVSGVLSASLSSISSAVNSLSAIVLYDCVHALSPNNSLSADSETRLVKIMALTFGLLAIALACVVSQLDSEILQVGLTAVAATGGPLLGLFSVGIFFPWPMARSALFGLVFSTLVTVFVAAAPQLSGVKAATPMRGISQCLLKGENASDFSLGVTEASVNSVFPLFRLSYTLICAFGALLCIVSTLVYASLSTDSWRAAALANGRLHYPLFYRLAFFLPERYREVLKFGIDYNATSSGLQEDKRLDAAGTSNELLPLAPDGESVLVVATIH